MKDFLLRVWDFLKVHDFPTFMESIRQLDWSYVLKSPYTWLIGLPILLLLIWTKRFKLLVGIASFGGFLLLIQYTMPPAGDQIALSDLLVFLGGAAAIVAVNLYFLLIRE